MKGLYIPAYCAAHARGVGTELACQSGMDCADMLTSDLRNVVLGDYPVLGAHRLLRKGT